MAEKKMIATRMMLIYERLVRETGVIALGKDSMQDAAAMIIERGLKDFYSDPTMAKKAKEIGLNPADALEALRQAAIAKLNKEEKVI